MPSGCGQRAQRIETRIVLEAVLGDVGDVHHRFAGEHVEFAQKFALLVIDRQGARRFGVVEVLAHLLQQLHLRQRFLVARLGGFGHAIDGLLDGIEIGQREFGIDHFDIGERIDLARDVNHIVVFKTAHHVRDGIGLADVREKLVAQSFALGRARNQPGDVDKFHVRRQNPLRLDDNRQGIETRVGHGHDADVGIDGAERIIFRGDAGARQRVEECGLADVGQSDDTAFESHEC